MCALYNPSIVVSRSTNKISSFLLHGLRNKVD